MADKLGVQFFTDAKAQYESAGKWRWVVMALLTYLHVGLVLPFAADTRDKLAVDNQLMDNRAAEEALKPVLDAADKLAQRVNKAKDQVASGLKTQLIERFQRLTKAVDKLAVLDPTQAEGEEGAAVFGNAAPRQMLQQTAQEDATALAPMNPELRRQIAATARAALPGEVPRELQTYIESELIAPAFMYANDAWANSGLQIARDGVAAMIRDITKARTAAPMAAAELDRLQKSVQALGDEAQRLKFAPPADPAWWRTVRGKEATILSATSDFAARVGDFNTSQMALHGLTNQIANIARTNQEAARALNDNLAELDKRAADLQLQLGEIGAPLKVISFKLSQIAPLTPLIIAAALAAIAAWTGEGLRCMSLAVGLVDDEADGIAIRRWLHAAAGGSRARVAGVELAVAIVSLAWVLVAAWNVAPFTPPFLTQSILAAIAVAVVISARALHWRRTDEAASA